MSYAAFEAIRTRQGKMTEGYDAAMKALRSCARSYSRERYEAAFRALQFVAENDEIASEPNIADAISDYCVIAKDKKLGRLAAKVDALHAQAQSA